MTLRRAMLAAVAACLLGASIPLSPFGPGTGTAGAWSDGPCPTAAGVTVVIDFQELGGGIWVRCSDVAVSTGFETLDRSGIPWTSTVRFPGFLCRIDGKPSASGTTMTDGTMWRDACQSTSPVSAHWSYWMATRGGSWCYSSLGGGSRNPPEGTVEAWSFSYGRSAAPRYPPPAGVPGAPTTLTTTGCDPSSAAPTSVPPTTPPAASRPSPIGDGRSTASGQGVATRPTNAADGVGPTAAAGAPGAPTSTSTPDSAAAVPTVPSPGVPAAAPDGGDVGSGSGASATPSTIIDDNGDEVAINGASSGGATQGPTSSPIGVVVALLIIGALTATSVVVRRRLASAP